MTTFGGFWLQVRDASATIGQDLRYAVRLLRGQPLFASACLGTVAVGIGATAVIFAVLHAIVLKPLPFRDPERLYIVHEVIPQMVDKLPLLGANAGHFDAWRKSGAFEDLAAMTFGAEEIAGSGEPEQIGTAKVTANLFTVLGVEPQLGRTFTAADDVPGHDDVVIISDGLWRRQFGADPAVLGRTFRLSGRPTSVVGIMPASFQLPNQRHLSVFNGAMPAPEIFQPIAFTARQLASPGNYQHVAIGRLRQDWTVERTRDALNATEATFTSRQGGGSLRELYVRLTPLRTFMVREVRDGLWLLMGAVAMVLLIICVNLANLLIARNARRQQEFAIRAALGAGRARLLRQLTAESLLLAVSGGALGLLAARAGLRTALHAVPIDLPRGQEVSMSATVILFALALSVLAGLAFGLLPVLRLRAASPSAALKAAGRTTTSGPAGVRARGALVAAQVALCTMLLVTCALLLVSFSRVLAIDRGFQVERIASIDLSLARTRYATPATRAEFFDRLLERVRQVSGVNGIGMVAVLPLRGIYSTSAITLPGDVRPLFERPVTGYMLVSPTYFETMGIALLKGRAFDERDRTRKAAIVSAKTARQLWPDADPIGKTFGETGDGPNMEVVGVVADVRTATLEGDPGLMVYRPYWDGNPQRGSIVVRTNLDAAAISPALREAVRAIDAEIPVPAVQTMETVLSSAVANRRFQLSIVMLFALCAVALASLGIFGVISHIVAQRTSEIGLRMALGAQARDLRWMVLGQGLRPVLVGLALGVIGALVAGRALRSQLFGVSPMDPAILLGVVALLAVCACAACYLPAQRATRIDPLTALRTD